MQPAGSASSRGGWSPVSLCRSASSSRSSSANFAGAAEAPVLLGTAASFGVLAGEGVQNTGDTTVQGDLGTSPNPAVVGFPPGIVSGTIHAADEVAEQAQADALVAYNSAAGRSPSGPPFGGPTDLGGMTLPGGVYKSPSSLAITGTLTLDGQNDPDTVFIFQAASTLITAVDSTVALVNGAQACNVFWQVGSSATLGVDSEFVGTILALTAISANRASRSGGPFTDSHRRDNSQRQHNCGAPLYRARVDIELFFFFFFFFFFFDKHDERDCTRRHHDDNDVLGTPGVRLLNDSSGFPRNGSRHRGTTLGITLRRYDAAVYD